EVLADLVFKDFAVGGRLVVSAARGNEVPLVHDDNDGSTALVRISADGGVGGSDTLGGVDDEKRNVRGFEMAAGHDDGKLLGHEIGFALASDSGGVDDTKALAVVL